MAWRDARAAKSKLFLFMASIVLGIAALVALKSFSENVEQAILSESKSLMGADYKIDSNHPANDEVLAIMDSLGGYDAREISFPSMVAFADRATKLMQVRGIEGNFPFYGIIETTPESAAQEYVQGKGALVDATVMLQFDLKPGDEVKVGNATLPILGTLHNIPGSSSLFSSIAPVLVIPYDIVESTGLVQTGSRIDYDYYFNNPEVNTQKLRDGLGNTLDQLNADLDTHDSTSQRLGRRYDNFGIFLHLVAFVALLLGCIGIASSMNVYIKEKLASVAILKCIGASTQQTFVIFLIQLACIGLIGGILGSALGVLLQQSFPLLIGDFLPVNVAVALVPETIFAGIGLAVVMSVLFGWYPLLKTQAVSPLQTLRANDEIQPSGNAVTILIIVLLNSMVFFSYWLLGNWKYTFLFLLGLVVTFGVLTLVSKAMMTLLKRYFSPALPFTAKQGMRNMFRPNNQTTVLVLAIGIGAFLISTLYFSKDILLSQFNIEASANTPNLMFLDVQSHERDALVDQLQAASLPVINDIPIVTMRVENLKGKSVSEWKKDTLSYINRWILNHEFRTTYRDSLISSEEIAKGEWTPELSNQPLIPISVSENFAEDARAKVGDTIGFDVQGVLMQTKIGSIRRVDWGQLQPNFSILFPKGVLEDAPQFRVISTNVPNEKASADFQRQLVKNFPTVTAIDIRQMLSVVEGMLNQISWVINFLALFSVFTGLIVLIGSIRTGKYQRIRESVLLRTMGATQKQIIQITIFEYILLGIISSFSGIVLALGFSGIMAVAIFNSTWSVSLVPFLVLFPAITVIVLVIGLLNTRAIIKNSPLEVLRSNT